MNTINRKYWLFEPSEWASRSSNLIQSAIDKVLQRQGSCRVMLTGGRSAERLYYTWSTLATFQAATGVDYFFGDERCVPDSHPDSNSGMTMRTLFLQGVPKGCSVCRMEADDPDREAAAMRYDKMLGAGMDLILLGVGDDGHIASLFPGSFGIHQINPRVVPVLGPKSPRERLTITSAVITSAHSVFVLAPGKTKAQVLAKALRKPSEVSAYPARMVLGATWLLDHSWLD